MIKNYYYFVLGLLTFLFAYTHYLNGQASVLPLITIPTVNTATQSTFIYVWHIITAENIIIALAFFVMSVHKDLSKVKNVAYLIITLMLARLSVILLGTYLNNQSELRLTLVDILAIIIYIILIFLGTRIKSPTPKN